MKNHIMFHLEIRLGENATSSNASVDFLDCYTLAGVGVLLNTEGKPSTNVEFTLWEYLYR